MVLGLHDFLTLCSPAILLLGVIVGLIYYTRLENIHRILLAYLLMALIIDFFSRYLGLYHHNNLILIPIFAFFELIILSHLYFKHLLVVKNRFWIIGIGCLLIFNLFEIFTLINVDPANFFCLSRVLNSMAIVVMSIVFYIKQIADEYPLKSGFMLLNTIIFAFQSLNLILYLPINFLINEGSNIKFHFWYISLVLTLIFYISIIRIIWIHGKNHKP